MERKLILSIVIITLLVLGGGTWLLTKQSTEEQAKLDKPLLGQEISIQGRTHVPDGTRVDYSTNPLTSGNHYVKPQPAGIFYSALPDGNLVHSLEHGAVILWYKSDLSATESAQLKSIFDSVPVSKKIMTPRDSLDVPVALTSWGRLLKLQAIDENQIKTFMITNEDRAPEKAPL